MSETAAPTVTVTGGWGDRAPMPPDRQPVARIPEQPNRVTVTHPDNLPSADDLQRARIARRRPADRSARAVQNALDAVVLDLAAANATLARRQDAAHLALESGTPAGVKAARDAVELGTIEVQQLEMQEAGLRVGLERALDVEAEAVQALATSVPVAAAKVAAFRRFIDREYPGLAAKIAAGMGLEAEAEQAHAVLRAAAYSLPGHDAPEPLPRAANGTLAESYRYRMSLPGTDVRPLAPWAPSGPAVSY